MSRKLSKSRNFMNWWKSDANVTCHDSVTEIVTFANVTRVTVCALLDVWAALNTTLKSDGLAPFMTLQDIDDIAEIPGFGEAMLSVGWVIELDDGSLVFPNFSENNNPSKSRDGEPKSAAQRAKEYRDRKRAEKESQQSVTPSRHVTGDKIREDIVEEKKERGDVCTIEQAVSFAKSNLMPPISEECARSWHDHMLSIGWQINNMPVLDWKAALRRWASKWNTNTQANRNNSASTPTPHKGIQEKIEIKRLL